MSLCVSLYNRSELTDKCQWLAGVLGHIHKDATVSEKRLVQTVNVTDLHFLTLIIFSCAWTLHFFSPCHFAISIAGCEKVHSSVEARKRCAHQLTATYARCTRTTLSRPPIHPLTVEPVFRDNTEMKPHVQGSMIRLDWMSNWGGRGWLQPSHTYKNCVCEKILSFLSRHGKSRKIPRGEMKNKRGVDS